MDIAAYFKGKRITLLGLGLLGRGVGDARFLAEQGAELTVTDMKTAEELAPSIEKLSAFPNIAYHLGGHRLADFEGRDMILRAPNAPLDSPFLAHARERGIPIEMDASLFAKLTRATIVGITGTRGKSTVTNLIYEMLMAGTVTAGMGAGPLTGRHVFLGGNVRDTATLPYVLEAREGDIAVLELDSWQLQGFEESKLSPHVSVWTNFMPDHMNYYKGDMERYFHDKAAIARFQKAGDVFVTTPEIKERIEAAFGPLAAACITDAALPADSELSLPGEHNRSNAALAAAAARALGVPDETIKKVLKEFRGLPGRLAYLGEKNGVKFYNDSNATSPEATLAALRTLGAAHTAAAPRIILIAGGSDKQLDFTELAREIPKAVKHLVLLDGTATEKLRALLPKDFPSEAAHSMDEACAAAVAAAAPGDIVLLSPAAASFGIFKNEYDRSGQFEGWVKDQV